MINSIVTYAEIKVMPDFLSFLNDLCDRRNKYLTFAFGWLEIYLLKTISVDKLHILHSNRHSLKSLERLIRQFLFIQREIF